LANTFKIAKLHEQDERRKLGAYYTPDGLSKVLSDWAIQCPTDTVLEPSFGGCGFLNAAKERFLALGCNEPRKNIFGCDIDPIAFRYLADVLGSPVDLSRFIQQDFLKLESPENWPQKFRSILANPPYISYQALGTEQRQRLSKMSWPTPGLGGRASLWAYFVARSISMLDNGGRMALVLPGAFLQANYAKPIRTYLKMEFERCAAIVLRERMFLDEGTDEETVVVLAAGHKLNPKLPSIQVGEAKSLSDIENQILSWDNGEWKECRPECRPAELSLDRVALEINSKIRELDICHKIKNMAKIQIGVVTGANNFFVLGNEELADADLCESDCVPILSKFIGAKGLRFDDADHSAFVGDGKRGFLIDTVQVPPSSCVVTYLSTFGEDRKNGISTFKKRKIWSAPNDGNFPDAFFPVMHHDGPRIVLNQSKSTCTNTIHRVYFDESINSRMRKLMAISILTTFSQVSAELVGRRYGSGVLKHEPREAEKIEILLPEISETTLRQAYNKLDNLTRSNRTTEAHLFADRTIYRAAGIDDWKKVSEKLAATLAIIRESRRPSRRKSTEPTSSS